jgi:methionyl-tRNA formyltransferase
MLRVAFAGTPEFAVPTLRALAASALTLVGVLTQPDRPAGRGRALTGGPVKRVAQELNLPLSQPATLRSPEAAALVASWAADVLVVVAYGLILPPAVLALPRLGCINVHASLLPRWRGAAPVQRAILAGDTETGITIMQMDAGLDTGPILAQERTPIGPEESAQQLLERLGALGAALLLSTLGQAQQGLLRPRAQPDQGVAYAAKIGKAEARIDWGRSAGQIARQVRAFNPRPVAETLWQGEQLRIWEARAIGAGDAGGTGGAPLSAPQPGDVLGLTHGELLIQCGEGRLALLTLQLAGRRPVTAREFATARALTGSRLG